MTRWRFDLRSSGDKSLPKPLGFGDDADNKDTEDSSAVVTIEQQAAAKQKQAMAVAYGPGKGLLTTGFMLWMSGSSIQIFSIMMTGMALINPLKAIFTVNQQFERLSGEGVDLRMPKLIFLALQIVAFGVALYKLHSMGLLPVTSSDWTASIPERIFLELSSVPQ